MKASVLKRTVSLLCTAALLLQFSATAGFAAEESDKNGDSYTKTLEIRTDMVHDNPGGNPYVTQYDDVEYLADIGLTGKVFFLSESAHLAIDWQDYDKNVFPEGSDGYKWVQQKKEEYRAKYKEAKDAGLKVYFMMDFISLPNSMKTLYGDAIMTNGKIDINKPKTKEIMTEMMREVFEEFPEIDGIYPRYGESYVGYYSSYHFGNNPIAVSGTKASDHATLLKFFRDEVCAKLDKKIVYRTWSTEVGSNSFTTSPSLYLEITNQVEPHENLYIAIKHTAGDFWRNYTFNETIGIGKHKQIIEVQCAREYEGKGTYPNYIAGSVINGFKEYEWQMDENANKSLRDVVNCENSLIAGIWTWSRGGGWGGPYPNGTENPEGDELWCDLNAYVLHKWAQDTSRTDKSIVIEYAKEKLGMGNADAENFYKLAALSSDAVLYGIGTDSKAVKDAGWETMWTRDASVLTNTFNSNLNRMYNTVSGGKYVKLEEVRKSVEMWEEMLAIANGFDDDVEMKKYIQVTTAYGHYLFSIWERMWTAGILYKEREANDLRNAREIMTVIKEFNDLWDEWEQLKANNPLCPTLYSKDGFVSALSKYECSDEVYADENVTDPNVNIALNASATASYQHKAFAPSHITNGSNNNTNKDTSDRWNAGNISNTECWIYVDLGSAKEFNKAILYWNLKNCPKSYDIQVSDNASTWTTVATDACGLINSNDTNNYIRTVEFKMQTARYVRIYVSAENRASDTQNWVSLVEFELYRDAEEADDIPTIEISDNLALNKTASTSYNHNSSPTAITNGIKALVGGGNASDRWNAGNRDEDCWAYIDLGAKTKFNRVTLYWNYNNCPKAYEIQVSDDAQTWTTVKTVNCGIISTNDTSKYILTDDFATQNARYVRLFVPRAYRVCGGEKWVSLAELEVYMVKSGHASDVKMFLSSADSEGKYDLLTLTNINKSETASDVKIAAEFKVTNTANGKNDTVVLETNTVYSSVTVAGFDYTAGDFDGGIDTDYVTGFILENLKSGYKVEYRYYGIDAEGIETWSGDTVTYTVQ